MQNTKWSSKNRYYLTLLSIFFLSFNALFISLAISFAEEDPIESTIDKSDEKSAIEIWEERIERKPTIIDKINANLSWTGYFKQEVAFRYVRPPAFSKILNVFQIESNYSFNPSIVLYSRLYSFYDAIYNIEDPDIVNPRKGPESILTDAPPPEDIPEIDIRNIRAVAINDIDIEFKELYFDLHFRDFDLRVGKQIVRWGVVEGSRVTDEINPLDMGEFILRDIVDRYIPLWMLKLDYYFTEDTVQFLWIIDIQGHKPALKESQWEQFRFLKGFKKKANTFRNSEVAFRLSRLIKGWDFSLSYFYTWDDFPAAFRILREVEGFGVSPEVDFTPEYTRLNIIGTTFSRSIGRYVLNSEMALVLGKLFGSDFGILEKGKEILTDFGEIKKNYIKYAVGLDFVFLGTDISLQFLQAYIINYESIIIQDKFDTVLGFFARKELFDNRLVPQVLIIHFVNNIETLTRPKIEYSITDNMKFAIGADILNGLISTSSTPGDFNFVGFFRNNDRVYFEIKYSF
ncbi:MAG: DUF1302 family protein [Nitrospirota bacterium]